MPRKKNTEEQDEKQLKFLKVQFDMHIKTLKEVVERGKDEAKERMELIIKDDIAQIAQIDKNLANKCEKEAKQAGNGEIFTMQSIDDNEELDLISRLDNLDDIEDYNSQAEFIEAGEEIGMFDENNNPVDDLYAMAEKIEDSFEQKVDLAKEEVENDEIMYNNVNPQEQFDVIKLPSRGECYKNKMAKIPVAYLTAADENLITSPNLYESGAITSMLLKRKIMNKNINIDSLVSGDVDAIMVFLRGTSYGNMFPIVAKDPVTKKEINTEVDLQKLHYKPFTLKGDEDGLFDFTMPLSGAKIKFRFLTKGEEKLLQKLNKKENTGVISGELNDAVVKIVNALKEDKSLSDSEKNIIIDAKNKIDKWAKNTAKTNQAPWTKTVSNTLEMQIVSVNGNANRKEIHNFVMNMLAGDSLAFRRYIYDNQPGVDFQVEVKRPESMGGGSFKCFLEWDDTVFWNIS